MDSGKLILATASVAALATFYWLPKLIVNDNFLDRWPRILSRSTNEQSNRTKKIALTFDDLPYGSHAELVKKLNDFDMRATLFVISGYVNDNNRQVLIDAVKSGHDLGNHGRTNRRHASLSLADLESEIDDCDELIRSIYAEARMALPEIKTFRPGCGFFNDAMIKMVEQKGYRLTLGSVYPHDPHVPSGWINYYYLTWHIEAGDIVILHDRSWTLTMLDLLLPWMVKNGYESVTVSELMG